MASVVGMSNLVAEGTTEEEGFINQIKIRD
jgi:hypothetical protein